MLPISPGSAVTYASLDSDLPSLDLLIFKMGEGDDFKKSLVAHVHSAIRCQILGVCIVH